MVIELRVVECQRDTPAATWRRNVLWKDRFVIEGVQADQLPSAVVERAKTGEVIRLIVHEVVLIQEGS